jgi:hypothetical protein
MNLKQFLKPSSENLTASGNSAFCRTKRLSNFYYWVKPDWRKIVIFIILLIIFLVIYKYKLPLMRGELPFPFPAKGLPLPIYIKGLEKIDGSEKLLKLFLIIDLIFWYFISCFIVWIYDKLKKKS